MSEYLVVIEHEGESWGAYCPDLPGVGVVGDTQVEVEQLIREAITFHLDGLRQAGEPAARSRSCRSSRFPRMRLVEPLVDITEVEVIDEYRLRLTFEDGTVGDVDFTGRQWRRVFEPLADPAYFARVEVDAEAGTIVWPNGPDMAPEPLYAEARRHPAPSARAAP